MFSSGPSYMKLKTNLRLCINRLKLLEKKKTELALKSRKEIADYISMGKAERAKIRVEHIIREDYLVEAMEMLEMFCDLLLARFGLIQQMKALDEGLAEAISSLIWVAPRLQADVQELKIVSDQLTAKYGKPYAMACKENAVATVSEKLMHKLNVQAPPKVTVEKYLVEIAKYYSVEYQPDPQVLGQDEAFAADALIDLAPAPPRPTKAEIAAMCPDPEVDVGGSSNASAPPSGAAGGAGPSGFQYPPPGGAPGAASGGAPAYPPTYQYPGAGAMPYPPAGAAAAAGATSQNGSIDMPAIPGTGEASDPNLLHDEGPPPYFPPDVGGAAGGGDLPSAAPRQQQLPPAVKSNLDMPELPSIPTDSPRRGRSTPDEDEDIKKGGADDDEDVDFDDLTRRFEALKKKK